MKCAMQACQNDASQANQVNGSFLSEALAGRAVAGAELIYSRLADRVTLYLCDTHFQHVTNLPAPDLDGISRGILALANWKPEEKTA